VIRPQQTIIDVALTQIGVRETSNNQGPGIEKYWPATSYPEGYTDRAPWCAAFGCWVLREAMLRNPLLALTEDNRPKSASVADWLLWAKQAGSPARLIYFPDGPSGDNVPMPGDIMPLLPVTSHLTFVRSYDAVKRWVHTIEGNTNDNGSSNGIECMERVRGFDSRLGFIRIAAKAKNSE
jgi:hypothetical protein